jgi:NDP-sugar pyrophosphorylase family protein
MTAQLPLEILVKTEGLLNSDKFAGKNIFDFLGKNLAVFIESFLTELGVGEDPVLKGEVSPHAFIKGRVYVAEGAIVEETAYIQGPAYIGPGAEIRHGAYIRGNAYIGAKAVVGHTTEVKNALFFDHAKAGHFAYVGDSILGQNVNLGAGTKLANLKLKGDSIKIRLPEDGAVLQTGLRKLGSLMGDNSQTGCNAVLSPGTILMPGTVVLPCIHFHGTLTKRVAI